MEIDLERPRRNGTALLDRSSGVAVLAVTAGLDVAEQGLTGTVVDLARRQDLALVCGPGGPGPYALTSHLRAALPRRPVIAVLVSDRPDAARQEFAAIANLLDNGAVAVAVALCAEPERVARLLAEHLRTYALLRLDRAGYRRFSQDEGAG
jgi:hypothetical protein